MASKGKGGLKLKLKGVEVEHLTEDKAPAPPQEAKVDSIYIAPQMFKKPSGAPATVVAPKPAPRRPPPVPALSKLAEVAEAPAAAELAIVPEAAETAEAPEAEAAGLLDSLPELPAAPADPFLAELDDLLPPTAPKTKAKLVAKKPAKSAPSLGAPGEAPVAVGAEKRVPAASKPPVVPASKAVPAPTAVPSELKALQSAVKATENDNYYLEDAAPAYVPESSKGFMRFITTYFAGFELPPRLKHQVINPNACDEIGASGVQTYKYQAFVREFMREASPYRGVLVYHGLGSGKTCTSIAAAQALYSDGHKKIIVMTPIALKENYLNELMFCGFRHFRLKNVWVSFDLTPKSIQLFAETTVGLPRAYIDAVLRKPPAQRKLWMPDLSQPESESNFDELADWERAAIREQLYAYLQHKITFIGYTGTTNAALLDIAIRKPNFFDNKVIIIDEVHNLTRLMAGKLEPFLTIGTRLKQKLAEGKASEFEVAASKYEPITPGTWKPKHGAGGKYYSRAYLFYRLLCQAKNTKIIALSGTPIVNRAVEFGILGNVLHGYFTACRVNLAGVTDANKKQLQEIVRTHSRTDFFEFKTRPGGEELFFTIQYEGYDKVFSDETALLGVMYYGENATPATIQELAAELFASFAKLKVVPSSAPVFESLPLFPPTIEEFDNKFVDEKTASIINQVAFAKRISGLVSYYKGSKKELMPEVTVDELVLCPFSRHAIPQYVAARLKELDEDPPKKSSEAEAEAAEESAASYRFRSRAICNFAFPEDIERPFPAKKEDFQTAVGEFKALYGDGVTDVTENPQAVLEAEAAERAEYAAIGEDDEADEDKAKPAAPVKEKTVLKVKSYEQRLAEALAKLRERSPQIFKMDPAAPEEEQLKTYSGKFAAILERIQASKGSSLVYSNFKTVEGIGVLAMALEANGFAPIRLTGSDANLQLAPESLESLRDRPEQPRYIVYSGGETIRVRQTLINLFNMRIDKLPAGIAAVLKASPLPATGNKKGEACRVFMITGAGAEGLSLTNVRTVHIMEPYWNKVRTEQVKGRAVRICSHKTLPYSDDPAENERTVEVYTYLAIFDPEMYKRGEIDNTIMINDGDNTSDQFIQGLANRKETISASFLNTIKASAVDCQLNQGENERIQCFVQEGPIDQFLYDPRLEEDIEKSRQIKIAFGIDEGPAGPAGSAVAATVGPAAAAKPAGRTGFVLGGIKYIAIDQEGKQMLYRMENRELKKALGEVVLNPETGKKSVKWYSKER